MGSRRILWAAAAGVLIFGGFSIYADVDKIWARLGDFAWTTFLLALLLALLNYGLRLIRWHRYLGRQGLAIPKPTSALIFLSGFALSITPGKVGELIKSYLLKETHNVPFHTSIPVVVAERIADLVALSLLAGLGFFLHGIAGTTVAIATGLVIVGLIILAWPAGARRLIEILTTPTRLSRFRPDLLSLHAGLADLVRPAPLAMGTSVGIVAWLAECIGFALILSGFPGTDVSVGLAILIYAATTIAGALSFLPGGLLVTEAAMTLLLVQSSGGLDHATAVSATILTRLATLWFAVAIGLLALVTLRRRAPRVSV